MLTQSVTLLPLLALGAALTWTALRPGAWPAAVAFGCAALLVALTARRVDSQQRQAQQATAALARRCAEQQAALHRAEAARAAAAADARASETRYALALRGSQDGLWEWDIGSGAVQLSPRWKGMLGFEPAELADTRAAWWQRIHPDDRPDFERLLHDRMAAPASASNTSCGC